MEIHQKATGNGDALLYDYDVFLSFRGPDTRAGFTDSLYNHLTKAAGLRVFRDDDELNLGDKIERILLEIDNSRLCIPVFSKTFSQSKWCLLEVSRMVEMQKDVLPIFYDVTVDDVKLETAVYNEFMPQHVEKSGKKDVEKWKEALKTIAAHEGKQVSTFSLDDTAFFEGFVKELLVKLKYRRIFDMDAPIGLESQVRNAMQQLDTDSGAVRYFGIYGMGGIGKTTLAKDIFNNIKDQFVGSCFLEDIRESFRRRGTAFLMKKLLNSLNILSSGGETDEDLSRLMEERFRRKKILIVLDDVDQWEQIGKLAGKSSWFGPGSRIIVTSRNGNVMKSSDGNPSDGEIWNFEMEPLGHDDALKLFNRHAFKEEFPPTGFKELSEKVVSLMGGLPLALKVIGSSLSKRKREVWEEVVEKLKDIPEAEVKQRLRISYDALSDEQKQIYLDIACFFVGSSITYPIYMWRDCQFHPNSGLEILRSMSLVKVSDDGIISMHDMLRDLGRDIVREESIKILYNRSRLWEDETAKKVLKTTKEKKKVKALRVEGDFAIHLSQKTKIGSLETLRYLDLQRTDLQGDFEDIFPNLIWLSYHSHIDFPATNFAMTNLVILDFSHSTIDENWCGWIQLENAKKLKVLDLSEAENLTRTPYFSEGMTLERLILKDCSNLVAVDGSIGHLKCLKLLFLTNVPIAELPDSIGELKSLVALDLQGTNISNLPNSIMELVKLEDLCLRGCHRLKKLPPTLGALKSLVTLDLSDASLVELPPSVGELAGLKQLGLSRCPLIEKLPGSLGTMSSLVLLDLTSTGVDELPESIGGLENLEKLSLLNCSDIKALPDSFGHLKRLVLLDLSRTGITELPESIGGLENLKEIRIDHCPLKTLPRSFGALKKLEKLDAESADLAGGLPSEISGLSSLKSLTLSHSRVSELPSSINQLLCLHDLHLWGCNQLQQLPDLPLNLMELLVKSQSLHSIPQFSKLQSLTELCLLSPASSNSDFGIWKLSQLVKLTLCLPANTTLRDEFGNLTRLKNLVLGWPRLRSVHRLPLSLEKINLLYVQQDLDLPNLPDLKNLSILEVRHVNSTDLLWLSIPDSLRELTVSDCPNLESWPDISHLKNLRNLHVTECQSLTEILGLGKLKCLEYLVIERCHSLTKLENLSELKQIESVSIDSCQKLGYPEGVDRSKVIFIGADVQEISEETTNEGHDICSLLSSPGRDFLIRGDGHRVKVDYLKGKKVCLYFHQSSWDTFAYRLSLAYQEWLARGDCVVVRVSYDSNNENTFNKWFSWMNWLAIPISDRDTCRRLLTLFKRKVHRIFMERHDEAPPRLVIIDESGRVLTTEGFEMIGSYGALAYPFTPERIQYLKSVDELRRRNQSISLIFRVHFGTDFVLTLDGNELPVSELEGKVVGIYFSASSLYKCVDVTRMLREVYKELKANGENFEIVWAPVENKLELYFQNFRKLPKSTVVSWFHLCFGLFYYFDVSALPTLVIIGEDGNTLKPNAAKDIEVYGAKAYPFTPEKIEKARNEECKRLVFACKEFVITNTGECVESSTLMGKNILLYFSHKCANCSAFMPKLIEAYNEIKARDDAFEVIFISGDMDEACFREYFSTMPWLALPFRDERIDALCSVLEVERSPILAAIKPTNEIIAKDVIYLITAYGSDAYPFTEEHIDDMVKSWPHQLQHPLHAQHELALTDERRYICDACDCPLGMPLWSYYCEECDFNLHPKCAFEGGIRESPEELGTRDKIEKALKDECIRFVVSDCRQFVITNNGERVDSSILVGKNILLYFTAQWSFCHCAFMPNLQEAYDEMKTRDDAFEVIFMSSEKDEDEASFSEFFSTMPWLALPFGDARISALAGLLQIRRIPALVAIGPTDRVIANDVADLILAYGLDAYPFTNEHVTNMIKSWPHKLQHSLHLHELALTERQLYGCDVCHHELPAHAWSYHCKKCDFDLHPKCAFKEGSWESPEEHGTCILLRGECSESSSRAVMEGGK